MCDCQGIFQAVLHGSRIVGRICSLLVTDLLDSFILCSCDRKSVAVYGIISLCLCIALSGLKVFDDLLKQCIDKIGIRLVLFCSLDSVRDLIIYSFCFSFLKLLFRDIPLIQHIL